eukprot:Hpha_TRINITY_DN16179_c3_g10::TRINITY_DN16179_c3_g10_i1::g.7993::m.7993
MPDLGGFEWHGADRHTGRARMAGKRVRSPICPEESLTDERPAKRRQGFARGIRNGTIRAAPAAESSADPAPVEAHGMVWVPRPDQVSPDAPAFAIVTPAPAQISGASPSALTTPRRQLVFSGATSPGRSGSRPIRPFRRQVRGRVPPPSVAFAAEPGKPPVASFSRSRTKTGVQNKPVPGYSERSRSRSASQKPPAPAPRATRSISQPRSVQVQVPQEAGRPAARQERKSKAASSRSVSAPAPPRGQCPPPQFAPVPAENPPAKTFGRRASGSAAQPRRTASCNGRAEGGDKTRAPLAPLENSRLQNQGGKDVLALLQNKDYLDQQDAQDKRRAQLVEARMKAARESRQRAVAMRGSGALRPNYDANSSTATDGDKADKPRWNR